LGKKLSLSMLDLIIIYPGYLDILDIHCCGQVTSIKIVQRGEIPAGSLSKKCKHNTDLMLE